MIHPPLIQPTMVKSSSQKVVANRTVSSKDSPLKRARKSTTKATTVTSLREPRRCHKCPLHPLMSECIHTVSRRAYLESQPGSMVSQYHLASVHVKVNHFLLFRFEIQQPTKSIDIGLPALSPPTSTISILPVPPPVRGFADLELQPGSPIPHFSQFECTPTLIIYSLSRCNSLLKVSMPAFLHSLHLPQLFWL